jgi:hypothetical protein
LVPTTSVRKPAETVGINHSRCVLNGISERADVADIDID